MGYWELRLEGKAAHLHAHPSVPAPRWALLPAAQAQHSPGSVHAAVKYCRETNPSSLRKEKEKLRAEFRSSVLPYKHAVQTGGRGSLFGLCCAVLCCAALGVWEGAAGGSGHPGTKRCGVNCLKCEDCTPEPNSYGKSCSSAVSQPLAPLLLPGSAADEIPKRRWGTGRGSTARLCWVMHGEGPLLFLLSKSFVLCCPKPARLRAAPWPI